MSKAVVNTAVSTVPQLTLKEAVVDAVNSLKVNGSFSAHDITNSVRAGANGGEFALPGLEAKPNNSNIAYWINHEDVKAVLETLLNDGTLNNLGLSNVNYNGTFRIFEFANVVAPATAPATPTAPAPTTPPPAANAAAPTVSPVEAHVKAYIEKSGAGVTMKQIQSALKVNGITCKDLADMVDKLGFEVVPGTLNCFSTYTVG
jgi:hypothetical protein